MFTLDRSASSPKRKERGVARRLIDRYCAELDASGKAGYLETDRPENVAFYQRFEFETVREMSCWACRTISCSVRRSHDNGTARRSVKVSSDMLS